MTSSMRERMVREDVATTGVMVIAAFAIIAIIIVSILSKQAGYDEAMAKRDADDLYVKQEMDKLGFCEWVKQNQFTQYCRRDP